MPAVDRGSRFTRRSSTDGPATGTGAAQAVAETQFAWIITTPERDLTGRTILAPGARRGTTRPIVEDNERAWSRFIRPADGPWQRMHRPPRRAQARRRHRRRRRGGTAARRVRRAERNRAGRGRQARPPPRRRCPSGPITVLVEGGDPSTEPALKKVYDDFKAQNPGVEWDIRAISGPGPGMGSARARRVGVRRAGGARDARRVCSFERGPVTACWRTSAPTPGWPTCSPECPSDFHLAGLGEATARAFPLALSRGVQTTGHVLQQGVARSGGSRGSEDDRRPQGDGEATGGARRGAARPLLRRRLLQPVARHVGAADDRGA